MTSGAADRLRDKSASSMRRQILGYLPANIVTAIISVVTVVVFTRLLSVREFGAYSLGVSGAMFAQASVFYALQISVARLYPAAIRDGKERTFMKTAWLCTIAVAAALALILVPALIVLPIDHATVIIFLITVPLVIFRAVVAIGQAKLRAENATAGFVFVECLHATLGFGAGLLLLIFGERSGAAALIGLLVGAVATTLVGGRETASFALGGTFDAPLAKRIVAFAVPLAGTYVVSGVLQYSDRFLIDALAGGSALGVYAVAFSLVERPTTLLCSSITTATFQMAVRALEFEGIEAARRQTARNGAALLALALPACAGLAICANQIAFVLTGEQFRDSVAHLIPPLAIAALIRNVGTHYFDHAFHLLRRSDLLFIIYGPSALANLALNFILIPRYGVFGAVWASILVLCGALAASITLGVRHFGLPLPVSAAARTVGATAIMSIALFISNAPLSLIGLAELVVGGSIVYVASAVALNVCDLRPKAIEIVRAATVKARKRQWL